MPVDISISAAAVFAQGILSFLSPCVLPLLPVYMGYLSGGTLYRDGKTETSGGTLRLNNKAEMNDGSSNMQEKDSGKEDDILYMFDRKKVLVNTIFFVLGISFVFFLLGLGATQLSSFFVAHKRALTVIGGILITVFGIVQIFLYGKTGFTSREHRLNIDVSKMTASPVTALVLGLTFSFAWTPCIGPVLSSVLVMAASAGTETQGFLLIGLYTLGFILPFLAVGLFTSSLLNFFGAHRSVVKYTVTIGGILMVIIGIMMITGLFSKLAGQLAIM